MVSDFSDAQRVGLMVAVANVMIHSGPDLYGADIETLRTTVGEIKRFEFLEAWAAQHETADHVFTFLKGCTFHIKQAIEDVVKKVSDADKQPMKSLLNKFFFECSSTIQIATLADEIINLAPHLESW